MCKKQDLQKKEESTMAAAAKNFVYEVSAKEFKKVESTPSITKEFIEECKKVAEKYRKKK